MGAWTITDGCSSRSVAATELMTIVGGPCPALAVTSAGSTLHLTGVNGSTIVDDVVLERITR